MKVESEMSVECTFYRLRPHGPWGDYGTILWHGFSMGEEGVLEIWRCGPMCPPVSVVDESLVIRESLVDDFVVKFGHGYRIQDAILKKVVDLNWHEWDLSTHMPPVYPGGGGEPEDYVLSRDHAPEIARSMGRICEIKPVPSGAVLDPIEIPIPGFRSTRLQFSVRKDTWSGSDLFQGYNVIAKRDVGLFCTQKMRAWIEECCGVNDADLYFNFQPCQVT